MNGTKHYLRMVAPAVLFVATASMAQTPGIEDCGHASGDTERIECPEEARQVERPGTDEALPGRDDRRASELNFAPKAKPDADPDDGFEGVGMREIRLRSANSTDMERSFESASGLRVASFSELPQRGLQIELENGQIWRQVPGDKQRLRVDVERNQTVDIRESRVRGYVLTLNELRRTLRVERIR